jgi:ferritin-like metal-binding protein YciE
MPDPTARELQLIKYLNEAYGKEKQLETVLTAQIKIVQKPAIKKRLQDHLKETKGQSKGLEKRIKALGGKATKTDLPGPDVTDAAAGAVANVANRALAAAKGPVQALRGTGGADNQLRNMRDAYWNEAEEIAHYTVIEAVADQLGDKETVKLAREFRRQEERMQGFIEKQIPGLVKDVIKEEVPKEERSPARASSSRSSSRSTSSRSSSSSSRSGTKSSRSTSRAASSGSGTKASSRSSSSKPSSSRSTAKSAPKTASRAKTSGSSNGSGKTTRSRAKSGSGSSRSGSGGSGSSGSGSGSGSSS